MRAFTILIGADLSYWALARQNPISHASVAQRIECPRIATGPKDILTFARDVGTSRYYFRQGDAQNYGRHRAVYCIIQAGKRNGSFL